MSDVRFELRPEFRDLARRALVEHLSADERAAIEAATGDLGNKPDAVKLGWLKMRTKESWTRQRYTLTVGRALEKLRAMVASREPDGSAG